MVTDGDCLIVRGKSFQYLEAVTVKVLSPAKVRLTEYVRRRGSFDDLKFMIGVYKFKQVSRYFGDWLLIILYTYKSNLNIIRCFNGSQCNEFKSGRDGCSLET